MSVAAIVGAGPIGSAIGQWLAERARFRTVRFIDASVAAAAGKALDLRQSGPIDAVDVDLSATADVLAAAGANVIVIADAIDGGEWQGETGLALVRQIVRSGATAPLVFAGPRQVALMETVAAELKVPARRMLATAASAIPGAVRTLVGVELGRAGVDVGVRLSGRPPAFAIDWSSATVSGAPLTAHVATHRMRAISDGLGRLWPPGPQAIGAATAPIVEGLAFGSRRLHHAMTLGPSGASLELIEVGTGLFSTVSGL